MDLNDVYIVINTSARFQSVILVTADREQAIAAAKGDTDFRIVQQSGKEYPRYWQQDPCRDPACPVLL
jgi:hypothetical protein